VQSNVPGEASGQERAVCLNWVSTEQSGKAAEQGVWDNLAGMAESTPPFSFQYRMISAPVQLSRMKTEQKKMGFCIEKQQPKWLEQRCVNGAETEAARSFSQQEASEINGFERATAFKKRYVFTSCTAVKLWKASLQANLYLEIIISNCGKGSKKSKSIISLVSINCDNQNVSRAVPK